MSQSVNANADNAPDASCGRQVNKNLYTTLVPKTDLALFRIPRCPVCMEKGVITPNPRNLPDCPVCGAASPSITDYQFVESVVPDRFIPWYAKMLLWAGYQLQRLGEYIKRECT